MSYLIDLLGTIETSSFVVPGNIDTSFVLSNYKGNSFLIKKYELQKLEEIVGCLDNIIEYSYVPGSISPIETHKVGYSSIDGYKVTIKYLKNKEV